MKISELISVLQREMERLGDRELLEGHCFGPARPFVVDELIDGDRLPKDEEIIRQVAKGLRRVGDAETYKDCAILWLSPVLKTHNPT